MKWLKCVLLSWSIVFLASCTTEVVCLSCDFVPAKSSHQEIESKIASLTYEERLQLIETDDRVVRQAVFFNLGTLALTGILVPKDIDAALEWYAKAGAEGHVDAMSILCTNGSPQWFSPLLQAAQAGDPHAQELMVSAIGSNNCVVDMPYQERGPYQEYWLEQTLSSYQKAAQSGDQMALLNLGRMYISGLGVQASREEGVKYWQILAEQGYPLAQILVAYQSRRMATTEQEELIYSNQYVDGVVNLQKLVAAGQASADELMVLGMFYADGYKEIVKANRQKAYVLMSLSLLRTINHSSFPDLEFEKLLMIRDMMTETMDDEQLNAANQIMLQCMQNFTEQCY